MILHSIVPPEQIFAGTDLHYEYKPLHGGYVQGVEQNGHFTISRLISTNPHMYLDPRYAPGGEYQPK